MVLVLCLSHVIKMFGIQLWLIKIIRRYSVISVTAICQTFAVMTKFTIHYSVTIVRLIKLN